MTLVGFAFVGCALLRQSLLDLLLFFGVEFRQVCRNIMEVGLSDKNMMFFRNCATEIYRFPALPTDHFNTTGKFGTQASLRLKGGVAFDRMLIYVAGGVTWALRDAGHDPEVVKSYGLAPLPAFLNQTRGRREVQELTGNRWVPTLVLDDGSVIDGSREIVEWAHDHHV